MGVFTAFLSEIDLGDLRRAGGKGANLGHLAQAGFPVPSGFCVLSPAYELFLETSELLARIQEILDGIAFSHLPDVEEEAARIRGVMESTPMPEPIQQEIVAAYGQLTADEGEGALLAVRSSVGTRDLSATSFPGQMDTYHNLRGIDEVLVKIRECWASAFSYAALVNRHARNIAHFDVFIAPVVQLMVAAESAGVIFTVNPLNNNPEQMAVNACLGLGESVVSGQADCDHFVVDRDSAEILEEEIADKKFKIVLDSRRGGGNRKVSLSGEESTSPSISGEQIEELVKTARAIEDGYGTPQDIEWAFSGGILYILQSRKIAGADEAGREAMESTEQWISEFDTSVDPLFDEFTLSNISEVLPGVLTPLSISDINCLDYGFVKTNTDLGLMKHIKPMKELIFLDIFYGRCHLNLSVVKAMLAQLPGANIKEFDRRETAQGEKGLYRPTPRNLLILPAILARLFYYAVVTPKAAQALSDEYEEEIAEAKEIDFEKAPFGEIFDRIEESRGKLFRAMAMHIMISQLAVTYFDFLCKITAKLLDDEKGALAARLVTGLQSLESARPSEYIWDLSRMVVDSERLRDIFDNNEPAEILGLLEKDASPQAGKFLDSLQSFLENYGYRGIFESEAMMLNWDEDPSYLFATIKNYLLADEDSSPRKIASRQERERDQAMQEAISRLKGPERYILRYILKQAQTFISLREYMKSILVKGLTHGKKVYRVVSRRLVEQGLLGDPEDIYFLTSREVVALATGRAGNIPVEELVVRRRKEYERNLTVILPEHSKGRPRPLTPQELEIREDVEALNGIGVSPGKVTGKARVITDPLSNAAIKPGEILVAPVTDAAWTPLFVTASATVVEVGGALSHGSIVAREFGIPCVVNATAATRIIKTGQMITVDGGQGRVYLHPLEG